jgi:hypothetical protein
MAARGARLDHQNLTMLPDQLSAIVPGTIFLFVGLVACAIVIIRGRVRILLWFGLLSVMWGARLLAYAPVAFSGLLSTLSSPSTRSALIRTALRPDQSPRSQGLLETSSAHASRSGSIFRNRKPRWQLRTPAPAFGRAHQRRFAARTKNIHGRIIVGDTPAFNRRRDNSG